MHMSVRIRLRVGEGKKMEKKRRREEMERRDGEGKKEMDKKQENCFHPVSVACYLLTFDPRSFIEANNI